jgi:hypothetical protein
VGFIEEISTDFRTGTLKIKARQPIKVTGKFLGNSVADDDKSKELSVKICGRSRNVNVATAKAPPVTMLAFLDGGADTSER